MTIHAPLPVGRPSLVTSPGDDLIRGLLNWRLWGRLGWLEVKRRYRRTVVGPFWSTLSLATFVGGMGAVGAGLWHQDINEYLPFLAAGMVVWILFSSIVTESCGLFVATGNLFRQLRFDYSILVYALLWRNFVTFLHNLLAFVAVLLFLAPQLLTPATALVLPGLAVILANGVWLALLLGMSCLRFRDLQQLVASLIQISLFITPVFWPPESLEGGKRFIFVTLNPLFHLIDIVRAPLLGRIPTSTSYFVALLITAIGWCLTFIVFRRMRKRIAYWS